MILFINSKTHAHEAYKSGIALFSTLQQLKGRNFLYCECSDARSVEIQLLQHSDAIVLYNYHPETLGFVTKKLLNRFPSNIHLGIMNADSPDGSLFDYTIVTDASIPGHSRLFKVSRLLPEVRALPAPSTEVAIGVYSFADQYRETREILSQIQEEFDTAVIKLRLANPESQVGISYAISKPGIKLEISSDEGSDEERLHFLAGNSMNVFPCSTLKNKSVSTLLDQAIAARKPLALTLSSAVKHIVPLFSDCFIARNRWQKFAFPLFKSISKYKNLRLPKNFTFQSLKAILHNSATPYTAVKDLWTAERVKKDYEQLLKTVEKSQRAPIKLSFNKILDDKARAYYADTLDWLHELTPEMMKRKIPRANVQQAFVFHTFKQFYRPGAKVLCVGSHEDTAFDSLKKLGIPMEDIDPVKDFDLNGFYQLPTTRKSHYDIVFSTSVIEHVQEDDLFLSQIQDLLAPNGVGIITCDYKDDFKEGDYIFPGNYRFYTQKNLKGKFQNVLSRCELVDQPHWNCPKPDFFFEGQTYTFATFVFKKRS